MAAPSLLADESSNRIVLHKRNPAQFSALANANEPPITLLLAFVVVRASKPEVRIAASLREAEELRWRL
jgi:hypothetical protein